MFLQENTVELVGTAAATGTTDITTSEVDTAGYGAVTFIAYIGSAAANNVLKLQHSDTSGSGFEDIEDSEIGAASKPLFLNEISVPTKRYVQAVLTRGTTTTVNAILAVKSNPRKVPKTAATASVSAQTLLSPASGTA